jgi:hypothetical protein
MLVVMAAVACSSTILATGPHGYDASSSPALGIPPSAGYRFFGRRECCRGRQREKMGRIGWVTKTRRESKKCRLTAVVTIGLIACFLN